MCGIAGRVARKHIPQETLAGATETMLRRGPDKSSNYSVLSGNTVSELIFSRLAIIDLTDNSNQPIKIGEFIFLMNGEIYNYKVLKSYLDSKYGTQEWHSSGDAEVALRYLILEGLDSIKEFDGMFAFALINTKLNTLHLARDFFGEKPLYFFQDKNSLTFASEPKTIWKLIGRLPSINLKKLMSFVTFGYRSIFATEEEFFMNLQKVSPGHIFTFSLEKQELIGKKAYKLLPNNPEIKRPRTDILNLVRKVVVESVGRRLESDVELSICLSGGLDSSIIAAIAKKDFGVKLEAYTLESKDGRYSEIEAAGKVAEYLEIPHHVVQINSDDFYSRIVELTRYHEAPISTISYYVQSFLMQKINEDGFKVSLMGTGADEIFSGYYDHHLAYIAGLKNSNKKLYEQAIENWTRYIKPLIRNPRFKEVDLFHTISDTREYLFEGSQEMSNLCKIPLDDIPKEHNFEVSILRNRMLNELLFEVVPVILHEDDRNSMMYSVENRSPFLSYDILDVALSINEIHLINNGLAKSLLRDAFVDYLPEDILRNPRKIGFNASFKEICDTESPQFNAFFFNKSDFWNYVDIEKTREMVAKVMMEDKYNKMIFNLVSSKVFFEEFVC